MLTFDRLLVPVDFSEDSMAVLKLAIRLAKKLMGPQTVVALHVVDEGLPVNISTGIVRKPRGEGEKAAKKKGTERLEKFLENIDPGEEILQADVVIGKPPSEVICRYAEEHKFDVIVIGAQGKSGALRRFVLGSTMARVQRYAPCPVLAFKDPHTMVGKEPV